MQIAQLDLKAQLETIHDEIHAAVDEVIDSTRYIMGPKVSELEARVAEYIGVKHAFGVSSGTDALLVSLMALNLKPDDIVITTPYSFFATAGVITRLGARPVFADIDPATYNIDPQKVAELMDSLDSATRSRVRAILPVHLYGQSADMTPLMKISDDFRIPVIEDCAQAIGTKYPLNGEAVRVGGIGLAGCFSFFPSKNLGCCGDGGMVVTNDNEYAEMLKILRVHGAKPKYYHSYIGGNFRLDAIQAAILLVKLPHLEDWHAGRQAAAARYDALLRELPQVVRPLVASERSHHIYNQYVISVSDRDGLQAHLNNSGISTSIYYPVPFHLQPCFKYLGYRKGAFPHAEFAAEHTLALPIYPEIAPQQQEYVAQEMKAFYK